MNIAGILRNVFYSCISFALEVTFILASDPMLFCIPSTKANGHFIIFSWELALAFAEPTQETYLYASEKD